MRLKSRNVRRAIRLPALVLYVEDSRKKYEAGGCFAILFVAQKAPISHPLSADWEAGCRVYQAKDCHLCRWMFLA